MTTSETVLGAIDAQGVGVRVEFERLADRFGHVISLLQGASATPLLRSREGTGAEAWPASPPLQQLSIERREPARSVALLVGMAGASHWSASVESFPAERTLVFDVACRFGGAIQQLGSQYDLLRATLEFERDSLLVTGRDRTWHCRLECLPLVNHGDVVLAVRDEVVDLQPVLPANLPKTIRWKYRLTIEHNRSIADF